MRFVKWEPGNAESEMANAECEMANAIRRYAFHI
jgi:hypothetical protein